MNYLLLTLFLSTTFNVVVSVFNLRQLVFIRKFIAERQEQDSQQSQQEAQDIHNILNNRLLDLQSRKYALQRGAKRR